MKMYNTWLISRTDVAAGIIGKPVILAFEAYAGPAVFK